MTSGLEGLVGSLARKVSGGPMADVVGKMTPALSGLFAAGGLAKIVSQFKSAGLASHADSWVGKGENQPITAEHVKRALEPKQIEEVAQKLDVPTDQAADALAQTLPAAIDHLTPDGTVPDPAKIDDALLTAAGR